MSALTSRANLYLAGGGSTGLVVPDEVADIDKLNENFRKIDALLGARNIPSASSYGGNMDGDLVYAQDTEFLYMYSVAGGNLITPRLPGSTRFTGTQAEMTAFKPRAHDGDLWFNTTDKLEYLFLSGDWVRNSVNSRALVVEPGSGVTLRHSSAVEDPAVREMRVAFSFVLNSVPADGAVMFRIPTAKDAVSTTYSPVVALEQGPGILMSIRVTGKAFTLWRSSAGAPPINSAASGVIIYRTVA